MRDGARALRHVGRSVGFAVCLAGALLSTACEQKAEDGNKVVQGAKPKVNLPPTPTLELPEVAQKNADGTWTVAGALGRRDELLGTPVTVKGHVVDSLVCSEEANGGVCNPPSHAVLSGGLDVPKPTMVVVGEPEQIAELIAGSSVRLDGTLKQWSRDKRIVRSEGLLELPPPPPPPEPELEIVPPPDDAPPQ